MRCVESVGFIADPHDAIVVAGDYNQRQLVWKPLPGNRSFVDPLRTHTRCNSEMITHQFLLDGAARNNLHQCNLVPNHQNRILDLIFISNGTEHSVVSEAPESMVHQENYHPALVFELPAVIDARFEPTYDPCELNFRKTDFVSLQRSLETKVVNR